MRRLLLCVVLAGCGDATTEGRERLSDGTACPAGGVAMSETRPSGEAVEWCEVDGLREGVVMSTGPMPGEWYLGCATAGELNGVEFSGSAVAIVASCCDGASCRGLYNAPPERFTEGFERFAALCPNPCNLSP